MRRNLSGLLRTSMMTPMERRAGRFLRAPDHDAGTGADPAAATDPAPDAGSILFPDDKPEGDKTADPAGDPAVTGDWKEYEADPAKSDAENAAAKVEHDKAKPADGDDKGKDDAANKVPEDGKYSLTMPEGIELDSELLDALAPEFKEAGLTQAQAQKLADKFIETQQARAEKQGETWSATITKWADDAKADKEIGGDKWETSKADAQRAIKTLGTPELGAYLNASGGGNHPELIRLMAKVGAMLKEDNPAGGGDGGGKPAEPAHLLFPSDAPKG